MASFRTVVLAALCLSAVSAHTSIVRKDAASNAHAKAMVETMSMAVAAQDEQAIRSLLVDSFVFAGCKGDYKKAKILEFAKLPAGIKIDAKVQSSKSEGNDVSCVVLITGFGADLITAEFEIHDNQFVKGKSIKC